MEFKAGTAIFSADGTHVGTLKSVVMTPRSQEVTNLVVSRGFLMGDDKIVPLNWVGHTNSSGDVILMHSKQDFDGLPNFEETQYVRTDDRGAERTDDFNRTDRPVSEADALDAAALTPAYLYTGVPGYLPINPLYPLGAIAPTADMPRYVGETVQNIPAGTIALHIGSAVITRGGDRAGSVEEVVTDSQGNVSHFIISKGLLFTTRKRIPTDWIDTVTDDGIHLTVTKDVVDRLPDYDAIAHH